MRNVILQRLRGWCQIQGFPFRVNIMLYLGTVTLAILFPVFCGPMPKMLIGIALCLTVGMTFIPFVERIASIAGTVELWNRLNAAKPAYSCGLMEEIATITTRMRTKAIDDYERVKYVSGWVNAAVMADGSIVLGQSVVEEFGKEDREGILGHEFGHKKGHHQVKRALLFLLAAPLFVYLVQLPFPIFINWLIVFAAIGLVVPLVSWPFEYRADAIAAKYVGGQKVIDALLKLAASASIDINRDSYTHPSISRRIKRLQRLATSLNNG